MLFIASKSFTIIVTVRVARIVLWALSRLFVFRHRDIIMFVFMVSFRSKLTSRQTGDLSEFMVVRVPSFIKPFMTTSLVAPHTRRSRPLKTSGRVNSSRSPITSFLATRAVAPCAPMVVTGPSSLV